MKKESKYPRLENRPIADLKAHPDGVRKTEVAARFHIGKCIDEYDLLRPLVLNVTTNTILDGDLILGLLRDRDYKQVPCWCIEIPEDEEDLVHLALNNHAGEWQWQAVSVLLKAIQDRKKNIDLTGFHESDTGPLLAADWSPADKGPLDGSDAAQAALF